MIKADDSSLDPEQLRAVEARARNLLDRADGWNRFPTPLPDILEAAQLRIAPASAFDPRRIMEFLLNKAEKAAVSLKTAISKVFGIYDADERLIHIDQSVVASKQNFLKLHETGHHELPTHRKLFRIFQDCEKTIAPEIADLFEREANNFAKFVLFQGNGFARMAADHKLEIRTPMKLAPKFGASIYASCREFARTNHRACIVYALEKITVCPRTGARAEVRRIEPSPAYEKQFGRPKETAIDLDHPLGHILPVGRRMTRPTTVAIRDLNGDMHDCVAEAFDSGFNVFLLLYPLKALTSCKFVPIASTTS